MVLIPLTLSAFLGATISGIVGMAGGAFLLGMMILLGLEPTVAIPVHALVQLVSNGTRVWAHRDHVRWRVVVPLALAALPGPLLGLWLLRQLDVAVVKGMMGAVILAAAWLPRGEIGRLNQRQAFALAGILGGILGVMVGAVGPLIAPFFLRGDFVKREIIATKAACQAYLHILKIVAFAGVGFSFAYHGGLVVPMAAATIAGTYLGKWLLSRISERGFVVLYRVVLSVLALRLVWETWFGLSTHAAQM